MDAKTGTQGSTMNSNPPVPKQAPAAQKGAGNRLHARSSVQRQVRLCCPDGRIVHARTIDISNFGLLVESEKAVSPGTVLSVQTNASIVGKACVRHCTPKGAKYRIGLHLPDRMMRQL